MGWKAFKWSTATTDNVESQGLSCKIGLSENASTDDIEDCTLSNAAEAKEGESEEAGDGGDHGEAAACADDDAGLVAASGHNCATWGVSSCFMTPVQHYCRKTCRQC